MRGIRATILAVAICVMAVPVVAQSDDPADDAPLRYVALGDSWPEGAHCGGCQTFVDLWADALSETTGREIVLTDLTGSQEPGLQPGSGETSTSLLASLRFNPEMREAIRSADTILISSGSNEIGLPDDPPAGGDCSGEALFDCIDAVGRMWSVNHDAVLDEIELLRAGEPTAIRSMSRSAATSARTTGFMAAGAAAGHRSATAPSMRTRPGARITRILPVEVPSVAEFHDHQGAAPIARARRIAHDKDRDEEEVSCVPSSHWYPPSPNLTLRGGDREGGEGR